MACFYASEKQKKVKTLTSFLEQKQMVTLGKSLNSSPKTSARRKRKIGKKVGNKRTVKFKKQLMHKKDSDKDFLVDHNK